MHATIFAALLSASFALASPTAPAGKDAVLKRLENASCTFSGSSGYASVVATKLSSCSAITLSSLQVPAGKTLNLEGLSDGTTVTFEGTTTWGFAEWSGPLFSVSGNSITVKGAPGSVLDGQGALWWDGLGNSGGKTKPKFFKANNLNNSVLDSIKILNAPINSFSINYIETLTVKNITIDNSAGDKLGGHNTDAFDINNSNNVVITGATVYNQDDCVAVNSGTNILFQNGYCSGGHGLSIGSVGGRTNNVVKKVTFDTVQMVNSQQSVRIKTISGATGTVDSITYKNIKMSGGTDYGIIVTQSYNGVKGSPTNGVPITNFVLQNVTGTVNSDAVNVYIECGSGSCTNWSWTGVSVTGGKKSTSCLNVPSGASC
ncbi:unnamed protein product [Discula destructiva]